MLQDYNAAMAYMQGLGNMVRLRGGLERLRHNSRLFIKLGRYG